MSAVMGVPDDRWGERVSAIVVLKPGSTLIDKDLMAHCRTLIAGYKILKEVTFAASLPISPTGKILKRLLRDRRWRDAGRLVG